MKTLIEFYELDDKEFSLAELGWYGNIDKALQTIELKLDKEGGEIKSEAWIAVTTWGISMEKPTVEHRYRYFYFNKPYIMFLKESDKELHYFAAQIYDITLFQN